MILQQGAVLGVAALTPPPLLWPAGHGGGADQDEERAGAQGDGGALQRGHGPHAAAGEEAQAGHQQVQVSREGGPLGWAALLPHVSAFPVAPAVPAPAPTAFSASPGWGSSRRDPLGAHRNESQGQGVTWALGCTCVLGNSGLCALGSVADGVDTILPSVLPVRTVGLSFVDTTHPSETQS